MKPIILHGHERAITYLKYSPDGDVFFSASKDGDPTMWNARNGERIGIFEGHSGAVFQLDVTSNKTLIFGSYTLDDTKYLLSASMDSSCCIWEVNTGKLVNQIHLDLPIRCLAVSEGNKYLCLCTKNFPGTNPELYIYDISNGFDHPMEPITVIQGALNGGDILSVIWGPRNEEIIIACYDGSIRFINRESGKVSDIKHIHGNEVTALVTSYDRTLFATCSKDAKAKVFDMYTKKEICSIATDRALNSIAISPILDHIVVVGGVEARDVTTTRTQKMESLFYNMATKEEIGRVKGSFGTMNAVQFNPDGKSFITGGEDGYVRLCFFDEDYFTRDAKELELLLEMEKSLE